MGDAGGEDNGGKQELISNLEQELRDSDVIDREILGPLYEDGGVVTNDKCPHCGSEERVIQAFYDYLVRHNKVVGGRVTSSGISIHQFAELTSGLIGGKCPTLIVYRDICRGCGMEYPVKIQRQDSPQMVGLPGQKGLPQKPPR